MKSQDTQVRKRLYVCFWEQYSLFWRLSIKLYSYLAYCVTKSIACMDNTNTIHHELTWYEFSSHKLF